MLGSATNLTNTTVRALEGFLCFLSDHWKEISIAATAAAGLIIAIVAVISLLFQEKQRRIDAIDRIQAEFDSEDLKEDMRRLRLFEQKHDPDFVEKLIEMLPKEDLDDDKLERVQLKALKHVRTSSRYSHIFHNKVFHRSKEVNDDFIKRAVYIDQVEFLLEIIEPIEKEKPKYFERQYDKRIFDECRRIFRDDLKDELKER